MRILVLNWQDGTNPQAGGAEVHLHEVFSRIVKMGHEVTLYCSAFPGARAEEVLNGIHIIREGGRYLFNFRVPIQYLFRFRHESYDIVVDDMNKIPFFTPLYVRKPLYVITHHLFEKSIFREASWPIAAYVYLMEKAGFALCRRRNIPFIVGSPSTKEELTERGFPSSQVDIINYCVDHETHHPTGIQRSAKPLVGYFGRLKKYKSIDHLLRAFARVLKAMPDVRLIVVGDVDYRKELEQLTEDLGIGGAVRFTGFVDEKEKVRLLQEAWFLVNPSAKEGWGLTVIEANACKTTVVASNVPGLRDAVRDGETGLLYEYGNIQELSDKMLLLLNDGRLREQLATSAYAWSLEFDWQVVAGQTVKLFEEHIRRHRKELPAEPAH